MCGIVGGITQRPIADILIEGLHKLEYRGYDSAGLAVLREDGSIDRRRALGKVAGLEEKVAESAMPGNIGISHTRWATHGEPSVANAHPHQSKDRIAVVHNGIIENYQELREQLQAKGYEFTSQTDTEVIAHLIESYIDNSGTLLEAVQLARKELNGAYALAVIQAGQPDSLVIARQGSPLLIGIGFKEFFIGSDVQAMLPVTNRFMYLENGDVAELTLAQCRIYDNDGNPVSREEKISQQSALDSDMGEYRHYMQKEMFEQPMAIQNTLDNRLFEDTVQHTVIGDNVEQVIAEVKQIQIIACGTSYHAGMIAKYWFESVAGMPCQVEVASEYRYRDQPILEGTLFITISQSGETADTMAALEKVKNNSVKVPTLSICNVPESSLVRESDFSLMTMAGAEIGVASTKAFTTQLVALQLLLATLLKSQGKDNEVKAIVEGLRSLPALIELALTQAKEIEALSERFIDKHNALFLGRGEQYPVAMEGALKLKEISYIHAEAYPAGELKHGPLALVDAEMPIVAVAPNDALLEKLKSNLEEVRSRGGELYVFADKNAGISEQDNLFVINMPEVPELIAPIVYTIPLQLLSYYVALQKGTDVDKPRNLAKSVTVE